MDSPPDDDARTAIWPEMRRLPAAAADGSFVFELELPVRPAQPVTVVFPAAPPAPADSLLVAHLPALCLRLEMPDGYPAACRPLAALSTAPAWLPRETLAGLEDDAARLWREAGCDLVAYAYIDHVQRAAEDVFGAVSPRGTLHLDPEHRLAVLDHDIRARKAAFESESFECGVCLDPKRGSSCHKMADCGHIFCLACLRDFYGDAIEQGNISSVRCLAPNCAKQRASSTRPGCKPKTQVSPSELLQMGLSGDAVRRYVALRYKTELESDKDTIYCPRPWCHGAARSKRHRKPDGLEFADEPSDDDDDDDEPEDRSDGGAAKATGFRPADLLCVCDDCGFAFCRRCLQTWHGEFVRCAPRRDNDELTEEEKASLEYLQLHTSPCPTCSAPAQKTHGCNHMICSRCDTHYCYLCSSWLDPANPYQHYNQQGDGKVTSCYMRLWELEAGDGDDVGLGFYGGPGPDPLARPAVDDDPDAAAASDGEDDADAARRPPRSRDRQPRPRPRRVDEPVAVAREAPLVLRLVHDPQPRAEQAPEAARQHHPGPAAAARGRARGRGQDPHRGAPARAGAARGRGARRGARAGARAAVGAGADPRQQQPPPVAAAAADDQADLDEEGAAWVRRFVAMALMDVEDDGDSESDDDGEERA